MVSSEAAPLAQTGGLADVVGALPVALREAGEDVAVVIPRYGFIPLKSLRRVYDGIAIYLGTARFDIAIYQAIADFPFFLVDCPALFDRKGLYGESGLDYVDNHIRFAVFARAALTVARVLFRTEIFHCHDWQSGLVPALLRSSFATDPTFIGAKSLFTIHNLGYQGCLSTVRPGRGGPRPRALSPGRPGVLRTDQLHQRRYLFRRRPFDCQPHLRPRNPDARVRLRPRWRPARPRRRSQRHPQRRRLSNLES